ncbi:hypothetical protein NDU88_002439 [Pleurodeles waltl]|uniref:Secreted protein n=1 Tax=Pleurodeles waltl TaxID=8319 RepID=A0AAV7LDS5_PLEWA|nr:hypothetical protein NDU88_002439 [Pleurodeles waltl]
MAATTAAGMRRVLVMVAFVAKESGNHFISNKTIVTKTLVSGGSSLFYGIRAAVRPGPAVKFYRAIPAQPREIPARDQGSSRPAPRWLLNLRCFPRTPVAVNRRLCRCRCSHLLSAAESPGTPEICRRFFSQSPLPMLFGRKRGTDCGLGIPNGRGRKASRLHCHHVAPPKILFLNGSQKTKQ